MTKHEQERRKSQAPFYNAIIDRRVAPSAATQPQRLEWPAAEPAIPGTIRKGVMDDWDGVERRRVPEVGME